MSSNLSAFTDRKVSLVLLLFGALGTLASLFYRSTILAFIGLTLVFWGALFLFVLPDKYVRNEVMDNISISSLSAIDRIIADANLLGRATYIPVPRELYLPYDIGFKSEFIYIPRESLELDRILEQAFMRKPDGLRLVPPGLALADLMEKISKQNFHRMNQDSLAEILPPLISHDLEIGREFEINIAGGEVTIKVVEPICINLCRETYKLKHVCPQIGCPLCSSIACILTRITKKPIMIYDCSSSDNVIEARFRIRS